MTSEKLKYITRHHQDDLYNAAVKVIVKSAFAVLLDCNKGCKVVKVYSCSTTSELQKLILKDSVGKDYSNHCVMFEIIQNNNEFSYQIYRVMPTAKDNGLFKYCFSQGLSFKRGKQ